MAIQNTTPNVHFPSVLVVYMTNPMRIVLRIIMAIMPIYFTIAFKCGLITKYYSMKKSHHDKFDLELTYRISHEKPYHYPKVSGELKYDKGDN